MENMSSGLPRVPFTVPVPGMTVEEYLQYQCWRIEIQVLVMFLADWRKGDKAAMKVKILNQLVSINCRAERFPTQPLPEDLPDPVDGHGYISMPVFLQELAQVFA